MKFSFSPVLGSLWLIGLHCASVLGHAEALPGTEELLLNEDWPLAMVDGIHQYLNQPRAWSAPPASELALASTDPLVPATGFEKRAAGTVEWPVFRDVSGEGWLLEPEGEARALVLIFPPIDATTVAFPIAEAYRVCGARVLVMARVGRKDGAAGLPGVRVAKIDRREFLWRASFELGRSLADYETNIALAGVRALQFGRAADQPALPVGMVLLGNHEALIPPLLVGCPTLQALGTCAAPGPVGPWIDEIIWGSARRAPPPESSDKLFTNDSAGDYDPNGEWIGKMIGALGLDRQVAARSREAIRAVRGPKFPDPVLAERCYLRLLNDTQHLMREAEYTRAAFWKKADFTSAEAFQKSAEKYRDYYLREVVGALPPVTLPPHPRSRKIYDTEKLTGWEVRLDVLPNVFAYGILLLPKDLKPGEKRPVVVCQHGLEGRPSDLADPAKDHPAYHTYAVRLCERGYIVFAPQNPYVGEERFRSICKKSWPQKLTLWSFILRQHEVILKWLGTQPAVDAQRIAFYGLSYGGKTAMRIPALLDGYCLSICSADYNEWIWKNCSARAPYSYLYTQEYDMLEWNLGNTFNYAELSWLIFPRPFMVERGHDDTVSCDEWVAYEFARTFRHYDKLGLGQRAKIEFFNGPHTINGVGTFAFLEQWLR